MRFAAIDVETANEDLASICQIGIATYEGSDLVDEWVSLIDPEDYFSGMNFLIHGISEEMVEGQPTLPDAVNELYSRLDGQVAVCHTHFDRVAISRACNGYDLRPPDCTWLDSARVTRRCWEEFASSGYGLKNVCDFLGYEFEHHDALADAKAAGHILLSAIDHSGCDLDEWLLHVGKRGSLGSPGSPQEPIRCDGNPGGDFYGEVLVFTGALVMPRREAAGLAAEVGCQVASGVTKKTTMLVVGDQDISKLEGHKKSSKHRKAEDLVGKGQSIRILRESDFQELVKVSTAAD